MKYQNQIFKIFPDPSNYIEGWREGTLSFTIHNCDLEFDRLARLSELLKTKKINIYVVLGDCCRHGRGPGESCYCGSDGKIEISCFEVEF